MLKSATKQKIKMTLQNYIDYAKQIATRCKAIGHVEGVHNHFTLFTPEDVLSDLRGVEYPLLACELPRLRYMDGGSDNEFSQMQCSLLILMPAIQGDAISINQAFNTTYAIAQDIVTKLLNDNKCANITGRPSPECLVNDLNVNQINIVSVEAVFESCFGWQINFPFNNPNTLLLDESKWTGETRFNAFTS